MARRPKTERTMITLDKESWRFYRRLSELSGVELDKVIAVALAIYSLQIRPKKKRSRT